ncbi:hypothetical protein Ancab_000394 [Ancistrocladus abbreviatus]
MVESSSRKLMLEKGYFYPELWTQVFTRLPVKTLLKLRCVCKEWRSIIDDPYFAFVHLTYSNNNCKDTHLLLLEYVTWKRQQWTMLEYNTLRRTIEFLDLCEFGSFDVKGYVNGLLLIINEYEFCGNDGNIILWNPSIRKYILLPQCPLLPLGSGLEVVADMEFGLGFDHLSNDYKVVAILYPVPEDGSQSQPITLVEVCSLRKNCWKSIQDGTPSLDCWGPQVLLEGVIHWLGFNSDTYDRKSCQIVCFDVSHEVFNYIMTPDNGDDTNPTSTSLIVSGESLAILDAYLSRVCIWVLEEYGVVESWVKRYTMDLQYYRFFHLKKNGDLLFSNRDGAQLYNIKTRCLKNAERIYPEHWHFVDTYVESLALLKGVDV